MEWDVKGEPMRVTIPVEVVSGMKQVGTLDKAELDAGMPYGDDFTKVDGVTPELIAQLKRNNVWTKEDMLARSHLVRSVIQQVYAVPLMAALLRFAKEE